jgi:hypothetical protein
MPNTRRRIQSLLIRAHTHPPSDPSEDGPTRTRRIATWLKKGHPNRNDRGQKDRALDDTSADTSVPRSAETSACDSGVSGLKKDGWGWGWQRYAEHAEQENKQIRDTVVSTLQC